MFIQALFSQRSFILILFTFEWVSFIDFHVNQYWLNRCTSDYHICPACFENVDNDYIYRNYVADTDFGTLNIDTFLMVALNRRIVQPAFWRTKHKQTISVMFKHKLSENIEQTIQNDFCDYFLTHFGTNDELNCDDLWRNYAWNSSSETIPILTTALKRIFLTGQTIGGISLCINANSTQRFANRFNHFSSELQFWLHCLVNPEIVLFNAFQRVPALNAFLPRQISTCGFVMVDEYAGMELNRFYDRPFGDRIVLAQQLLTAAEAFSLGVHGFR